VDIQFVPLDEEEQEVERTFESVYPDGVRHADLYL
jgi:hypothetical protein